MQRSDLRWPSLTLRGKYYSQHHTGSPSTAAPCVAMTTAGTPAWGFLLNCVCVCVCVCVCGRLIDRLADWLDPWWNYRRYRRLWRWRSRSIRYVLFPGNWVSGWGELVHLGNTTLLSHHRVFIQHREEHLDKTGGLNKRPPIIYKHIHIR